MTELRGVVLPAVLSHNHHNIENIFEILVSSRVITKFDTVNSIMPLLQCALDTLHPDYSVPPTTALIQAVKDFVVRAFSNYIQSDEAQQQQQQQEEEEVKATAAKVELQLMLPLIGGMSTEQVLYNLPSIIAICSNSTGSDSNSSSDSNLVSSSLSSCCSLKTVFSRITKARPPPLTKIALLVALHR